MAQKNSPWRKLSIGAITGSVLLSGCFGTTTNKNVSSVKSGQKVTITMWGLFEDASVWKPIIQDYQANNPNITINYVKKDYSSYTEDSFDSLAARTGPDIWTLRNDWMPRDYEKLVAAPDTLFGTNAASSLTKYKNTIPDVAYNDSVVGGKIYGIPLSVDTLQLYYNKDIFHSTLNKLENSGTISSTNSDLQQPPATWKDVVRYDNYLAQKDGNGDITRAGIALGGNNIDNSQDVLAALMLQTGTQMVTADRKSAGFNLTKTAASGATTVPGNDALTFFRSFSDSSNANYTWPTNFPNSTTAFEQGKVAMILDYGYLANTLKQDAPTLNYGVAALPQIEGTITPVDYASYWLEGVTKSSAHSDVAWDFLKFASDRDSTYASGANLPSATRFQNGSQPATIADRATNLTQASYQKLTAQDWYKGRRPIEIDGIFQDLITAVVGGDAVQHALDSAAKRVTDYLTSQTPAPTPESSTK